MARLDNKILRLCARNDDSRNPRPSHLAFATSSAIVSACLLMSKIGEVGAVSGKGDISAASFRNQLQPRVQGSNYAAKVVAAFQNEAGRREHRISAPPCASKRGSPRGYLRPVPCRS
ncbi:MAG: hypothetical protein CR217_00385 [Beijerinckiaceae bacterium]|nr:MAG: hypothetical protein CR217_00385 [Beijerinckiaceae bacterium]